VLAALDELRRRWREGTLAARAVGHVTLGDHLERWLAGRRGTLSPKSWQSHERNVRVHISPRIGSLRLCQLSAADLRALYGRLLGPPEGEGDLGPRAVRYVHSTLCQALDQAVDDGAMARNVARQLRSRDLPKLPGAAVRPAEHTLSPDELHRFLGVARGDRLAALWLLASRTGLRRGEVLALRWSALDWETGTLTVARSRAAGQHRAGGTKTLAGLRTIELSVAVRTALRAHRAAQAAERLRAGGTYADNELVFATRWGTPLSPRNLLRRFKQLAARAGLPATVHLHDLRHTAISHQLAAGVALPEVSAAAGHATPAVTTAVYAHWVRRAGATAAERLERFYARQTEAAAGRGAPEEEAPATAPDASAAVARRERIER
jgi:integrase